MIFSIRFTTGSLPARFAAVCAIAWATAVPALANDWPQWRGPTADGVSAETGIPIRWGGGENIAWRAPLEGLGTSTPIIWADRIFVTSQLGRGGIDERGARFHACEKAPSASSRQDRLANATLRVSFQFGHAKTQ